MNQKELLDKWAKTHVHIKDFEEWKKVDPYFFGYENHGSDLEDFSKFVISQQQEAYKINYVKCPKCENTQYRKSMMDKGLCTCCGESVKFLNPFEIYKQKLEARFIATVEEFFDAKPRYIFESIHFTFSSLCFISDDRNFGSNKG